MSHELISILVLVVVFLIATVLPVHMGALALVAAFIVGTTVMGEDVDTILSGFPADLFLILVGVTYLFALTKDNGTIDWLVAKSVKMVGGRIAWIPWVMFAITGIVTSVGAVVPAAVAIVAPIAIGFGKKHGIRPLLMGLMVIIGSCAGGFSPISIFGSIVNGVVTRNDIPGSPTALFLSSLIFNVCVGVVAFFLFGGRELIGRRELVGAMASPADAGDNDDAVGSGGSGSGGLGSGSGGSGGSDGAPTDAKADAHTARAGTTAVQTTTVTADEGAPVETLDLNRSLTLVGIVGLVIAVLGFGMDVGFTALIVAVLLSLASPGLNKGAVSAIAWPTVLLICGIVTYVSLMERIGTIDWLGNKVAGIGAPLLAAIVICFIGAIVSAFASTTGILGALIPLAVPFLLAGEIGPIGLVIALSLSSSIVDSSPFSTSGALVVANTPEDDRDAVFKQLMRWGFSMVLIIPILTWLVFVLPDWA